MASPRSMWSGSIQLGLLNVPVTIGKAWADEREQNLVTLCADHKVPIDRTERCGAGHKDCSMTKVRGVQTGEQEWTALNADQYGAIEESTKSDVLAVLDVQPVYELPIDYATGTYYVRPDKKAKGAVHPFAVLSKALQKSDFGLVVKWCKSARQQLAVIHYDMTHGIILLKTIPYVTELREPGDQEKAHQGMEVQDAHVDALIELLETQQNGDGFQHDAYKDNGLALRTEAVEKILGGIELTQPAPKPATEVVPDLMATLKASMAQVASATGQKKPKGKAA